jgi:ABC-type branched-subunit amino acid transport system substrate-binding protein
VLVLLSGLLGAAAARAATAVEVAIGWLGDPAGPARQGAEQGLLEANRQGRFLGQSYRLVSLDDPAAIEGAGVSAIVTSLESARLPGLVAAAGGRPVFNVGTTADADRALCLPGLFHIQPSEGMRAAALAQWLAAAGAGVPTDGARAVAWNAGFERYAALQLNKRYSETHGGAPMDDAAWAGWAAVRLYADAVARVGTEPARMLAFLREGLAFDGQKGIEMDFRSSGQLRQVILIERNGVVVGETPVRGQDLESLGGGDCP